MQATQTNELIQVVESNNLEATTAKTLKESFLPFFEQAEAWKSKAHELVVTDVSQTREMKMAREARLALKDIRVSADKKRKELKEDSLRYGKAVQGVYNVIEYLIAPIEKHLEEQEKFAEIQEAKQREILKSEREAEISAYSEFVPFGLDFGRMSEDDYQKTLNGAKLQLQQKEDAIKQAEAERIAREKAVAEERERMRIENEKLKAEREAREKEIAAERAKVESERKVAEEKARKEREEAELKLKAEREASAKLEAELKAKKDAEERATKEKSEKEAAELKAKQLAEKKAKSAPDKAKLEALAVSIESLQLPTMSSEDAEKILANTRILLGKVTTYIRENTSAI